MSIGSNDGDSRRSLRETAGKLFKRIRDLPLAEHLADLAKDELDRMMGVNQYGGMDAARALKMSSELNQILNDLISECGKEEARLTKQTGIGPFFRGRELNTTYVDMAVGGLAALVYNFQNSIVAHIKKASDAGSLLARRMLPKQDVEEPNLPTVLDSTTVVGTLSPERAYNVAERLQRVYQETISIARRIQASLGSPNPSSAIAHDRALGEAVMLVKRLLAACSEVEQLLGTGTTGKFPVVPRLPSGGGGGANPGAEESNSNSLQRLPSPPKRVVDQS